MSWYERLYHNETDIDFPRLWKKAAIASGVVVAICLIALFSRGLNLGIEFEGGAVWEVNAEGVAIEDVRDAVGDAGQGDASIQTGGGVIQVRAEVDSTDETSALAVSVALADLTGVAVEEVSFSEISASWGDDVTEKARRALVIFLIAITIYISLRLEWKMAVGALVAVAHDTIVTVGVYAIFQFEVSSATVIAFLTILGYSLYDTMVVFDKVKENEARLGPSGKFTYTDLVNLSLNQVIMRSINTTITSVLPVASVLVVGAVFLGGGVLADFAIALLVGLLVGTYSSIFVATPVVAILKEREPGYTEIRERIESQGGERPPVSSLRQAAATAPAPKREAKPGESMERHDKRGRSASRTVGASSSGGRSSGSGGGKAAPSGAIPPRPRKKKR